MLTTSQHTIRESDYYKYFDSNGNLVASDIGEGDTINLAGNFTSKNFVFSKKVNVFGTFENNMKNSKVTFLSGASGSSVSNLNIKNTVKETYGIFLNSACNCTIKGCTISNTGASSYTICVANNANYNNIVDNNLKTYGITYGHGTRSTPALILSGSHHNYISNNNIAVDDANGIYLSHYSGGPLNGGQSNFNVIYNNTIKCSENILPTSWCYLIQIIGNNNTIQANKVYKGYRGISTSGIGNIIIDNFIANITGADYNHLGVESGGEYAIVASSNSVVRNNTILNCKIISTGAGISGIDNTIIENNFINVSKVGRGINAAGSYVKIINNNIFTTLGSGIYQKDDGKGLLVKNNNITSVSGVGILIEKLSSKKMPSDVTIIGNRIQTSNNVAIDASGVQEDTSNIDILSNNVSGKLIYLPNGVIDTSQATYIFNGTNLTITNTNFDEYINVNGGLTEQVKDGDILNFFGTFSNKVIYVNKAIKITGKNPIFYNSTFKVTETNVLIENLTIINSEADRVNAWGIFVNQANGVRIQNNNIYVADPKAAYAIYILESSQIDVWDNTLTSSGNYLTFTLLSYASEECNFKNNKIKTLGTGEVYSFSPEKCIDGNELVINGKSYCIDGNELVIDGQYYCIDGNELVINGEAYSLNNTQITINGTTYCIDGNELVIDGKTYCIDGNELVIDGVSYGSEYSTSNAHVVSEIYQTYGILLLYSSKITINQNEVNVTSKLNQTYSTIGKDNSTNSLVGIDIYFNSHNNIVSQNTVNIQAFDNYIYGMGVLGYNTGHKAPEGQGAINNTFSNNFISLNGVYFATGLIVGCESHGTLLLNNTVNLKSNGVVYGMTFEMSHNTTSQNNKFNLSSEVIYGIESYNSNNNKIISNDLISQSKQVYGMLFSNSEHNSILKNYIFANATGEDLSIINLDKIECGYEGINLLSNSSNNQIKENNITSTNGYAISIDSIAVNNTVVDNYLDSNEGCGDGAVNGSLNNIVQYNYKYIANPLINVSTVYYLENGVFNLIFDGINGSVKFYDIDMNEIGEKTLVDGVASQNYTFDATYTPASYRFYAQLFSDNYKASIYDIDFDIEKANPIIIIDNISMIQGDTQSISLKIINSLGNPIKGANVNFVMIRARDVLMGNTTSDSKGIAKISYTIPPSLDLGDYNVRVDVTGLNCYRDINHLINLTVLPRLNITIDINSNAYTKSSFATIKDSNGDKVANKKLSVKIASVTYSITTNKNGEAVLPGNVKAGLYKVTISSPAEGKYNDNSNDSTVVITDAIIGGKDYTVYYGNTIKYQVCIFDITGKVAASKTVTFNVNGKSVNVKSNSRGYATYSVKLTVGKYTITANYNGFSLSNKITIKSILIAKNIVKKKSKTIKFSVKLVNNKGKVANNKKIIFKIKNKKYVAKTNKKGIATASIKSLKVGKYTIISKYGGCSIKNTIKIKK